MGYNGVMGGPEDDNGRPDISRGAEVPEKSAHLDISAFRLDTLSRDLLRAIDGRRSAAEISHMLEQPLVDILERLDALAQARIVTLFDGAPSGQRLSRVSVVLEQAAHNTIAPTSPIIDDRPPSISPSPSASSPQQRPQARQLGDLPPRREPEEGPWIGVTTGSLDKTGAGDVIAGAKESSLTGGIRFERGGISITVHFDEGNPIAVESTKPEHEHGDMLARSGKIDHGVQEAYRAALERGASSPVAALMQAGIADRPTLGRLVAWRGGTILGEVQGWTDGTFSINPGAPIPPKVARIRLKALHRPKVNWREVHLTPEQSERLDALASRYMVIDPNAGRTLIRMGLTSKEARLVKNIAKKPMQVREALSISTLFRSLSRKLVFHLIDQEIFTLHETNPEGNAPIPLNDIVSFSKLIERDNDFNVLTAHASSVGEEIEARYRKRLEQFDPSLYPSARPEHLEALEIIRERLDRAWENLKDPTRRGEYRRTIYGKDQLEMFYDLQMKKAEMSLRMRQNSKDAALLARSALEVKPNDPNALLILASSLAAMGQTSDARKILQSIRSVSPRLASELAELKKALGG